MRPNPKNVDFVALLRERVQHNLIDIVARHNFELGGLEATLILRRNVEPTHLLAEICEIAAVEANSHRCVPALRQRRSDAEKVREAGVQRIVCINEREELIGEGDGVRREGSELAFIRVRGIRCAQRLHYCKQVVRPRVRCGTSDRRDRYVVEGRECGNE